MQCGTLANFVGDNVHAIAAEYQPFPGASLPDGPGAGPKPGVRWASGFFGTWKAADSAFRRFLKKSPMFVKMDRKSILVEFKCAINSTFGKFPAEKC